MISLLITYQTQKRSANVAYKSACLQASEEPPVFDLGSDAEDGEDARDMRDADGYGDARALDKRDNSSHTMLLVKPSPCFALHSPLNAQLCSANTFRLTCFSSLQSCLLYFSLHAKGPRTVYCMAVGQMLSSTF